MKIASFLSYYVVIYGLFGCTIFFNIIEHKSVFLLSLQVLSALFLILRRIKQGIIIELGYSPKISVILVRFKLKLILSAEF